MRYAHASFPSLLYLELIEIYIQHIDRYRAITEDICFVLHNLSGRLMTLASLFYLRRAFGSGFFYVFFKKYSVGLTSPSVLSALSGQQRLTTDYFKSLFEIFLRRRKFSESR